MSSNASDRSLANSACACSSSSIRSLLSGWALPTYSRYFSIALARSRASSDCMVCASPTVTGLSAVRSQNWPSLAGTGGRSRVSGDMKRPLIVAHLISRSNLQRDASWLSRSYASVVRLQAKRAKQGDPFADRKPHGSNREASENDASPTPISSSASERSLAISGLGTHRFRSVRFGRPSITNVVEVLFGWRFGGQHPPEQSVSCPSLPP